jgi:hypothetical protein
VFEVLVAHYNVPEGSSYFEVETYPIRVGQVLVPMAEDCKKYAAPS